MTRERSCSVWGLVGVTVVILLISVVAQVHDLALKFEGTPTANMLSDASQAATDAVVADGRNFHQGDFACFEAPPIDLATGLEVGTGVRARLSGAVNLSLPNDQIFFSYLFIVERPWSKRCQAPGNCKRPGA